MKRLAIASACGLALTLASPAEACLSCGCSGSGISGDLSGGGTAFLFSNCAPVIVQQGVSFRSVTGSFNEAGAWNPTPEGGRLDTLQGSLGLSWFPDPKSSVSLQLPMLVNNLDRATWGPLGSVAPTELAGRQGYGVGDIGMQGAYKLYETPEFGVASWLGGTAPSGRATGDPEALSGAGVWNAQGGVIALGRLGEWQLSGNVGFQRPITPPPLTGTTFYIGNAWMYQAQAAYTFNAGLTNVWSAGLGVQGFMGEGRFGPNDLPFTTTKWRVVPSMQYEWDLFSGLRISLGLDPALLGTNSMTDYTIMTSLYQSFTP